jgi:phospholipase C
MGFYSMSSGDAPYFRELAQTYALADNDHQPVMGGTGANFLALSTGDAGIYLSAGQAAVPPANQIEDPDPLRHE